MAKILVAEHNASVTSFLQQALQSAGHEAVYVDNSLDAWRACGKDEFDVLLVDVMMPGIDGFVLAQRAIQENPAVQVIFVTGFAGVAMDTYATPSFAPAPVTTRPFHLKRINARIRALTGYGFYDGDCTKKEIAGTVIYADFAQKKVTLQQA